MSHADSFSVYRTAVLNRVAKPEDQVDEFWLSDMIEAGWLANLDEDDAVDMIAMARVHGERKAR